MRKNIHTFQNFQMAIAFMQTFDFDYRRLIGIGNRQMQTSHIERRLQGNRDEKSRQCNVQNGRFDA